MRDFAIILLISLTPLILLTASGARAESVARGALKHASPTILMVTRTIRGSELPKALGIPDRANFAPAGSWSSGVRRDADRYRRSLATVRMITWADCDAFANGNAFSIEFNNRAVDASGQGTSTSDDEHNDGCSGAEEGD
jgi:hypothetical protein